MELQKINNLRNSGYYVAILNGAECKNLTTFISSVARLFQFPSYYGHNINAFIECINDLDWIAESNYALVIDNSAILMSNDNDDNRRYITELLEKVSKEWENVPNYQGEDEFRHKADFKVIYN
jgi:hypothetical protein